MSTSLQVVWLTRQQSIDRAKLEIVELEAMFNEFMPRTQDLVMRRINVLKCNIAVWENVQ